MKNKIIKQNLLNQPKEVSLTNLNHRPFDWLMINDLTQKDTETLDKKIEFLHYLLQDLESLEDSAEKVHTRLHWSSIFSGFAGASVIAAIPVFSPAIGFLLATTASVSALGIIALSFSHNRKNPEIVDTIKRARLVLKSDKLIHWAAIWQFVGVDLFCSIVREASKGEINNGHEIIRPNKKTAITIAIEIIASNFGHDKEIALNYIRKIRDGHAPTLTAISEFNLNRALPEQAKIQTDSLEIAEPLLSIQPETERKSGRIEKEVNREFEGTTVEINLRDVTYELIDRLVEDADKQKLGGCVILAAPGAGKTTLIGVIWGKLKEKFEDNFYSLAIIMKTTDVKAFSGIADRVVCAKLNTVLAAIEIIKFIDDSMTHTGQIRRLFLDDFVSMYKNFESALKGLYLHPETYEVFVDRKEDSTYSAQPMLSLLDARLNEFWLVGREYNACLWLCSHSSNVTALSFVGSREARSVGDLIFLAKSDKREFIEQALNNSNLIGDNIKRQVLKMLLTDKELEGDEPLILANHNNWSLGLVGAEVREQYEEFREIWANRNKTENSGIEVEMFKSQPEPETETVQIVAPKQDLTDAEIEVVFNIAIEHLEKNRWEDFSPEDLSKINRFKDGVPGRHLRGKETERVLNLMVQSRRVFNRGNGKYFFIRQDFFHGIEE